MSMSVILGLVGGIIVLVSMFLPWLTVKDLPLIGDQSYSGLQVGLLNILALVVAVVGIALMFIKKPAMPMVSGIMGILVIIFWLLSYLVLETVAQTLSGLSILTGGGMEWSVEFGVWLMPIGAILLIVGGFMRRGELKKAGL